MVPIPCWSEIYVGAYFGGNFVGNSDPNFECYRYALTPYGYNPRGRSHVAENRTAKNVGVDPAIIFGGKVGYWFTKESFFGLKCPNWLKHLGLELDVNYHRFDWPEQTITISQTNKEYVLKNYGSALTAALLFMFRYGFLPDSEVPFGRLQPYIGLGPMVFVTNTKLNIGRDFKSTEGKLGFALETGIRYLLWKHISINCAFKYRYVNNRVIVDDTVFDMPPSYIRLRTKYNLYDIVIGMAYHF